jgi:hypothetical protein
VEGVLRFIDPFLTLFLQALRKPGDQFGQLFINSGAAA